MTTNSRQFEELMEFMRSDEWTEQGYLDRCEEVIDTVHDATCVIIGMLGYTTKLLIGSTGAIPLTPRTPLALQAAKDVLTVLAVFGKVANDRPGMTYDDEVHQRAYALCDNAYGDPLDHARIDAMLVTSAHVCRGLIRRQNPAALAARIDALIAAEAGA